MTTDPTIRAYMAAIGRVGGKTTGDAKRRGDRDYYREIGRKAAAARRRKRETT